MPDNSCPKCGLLIDAKLNPESVQIHGYGRVLDQCPNILEDRAEHPDWEPETLYGVPLMRAVGNEYQGQP